MRRQADVYRWQYNDGGTDEGFAKKNDVTWSENPNLIADELHVSCSDTITNGVPRKSDLGSSSRRVTACLIINKGGKKTCGQGRSSRRRSPSRSS